MDILGGTTFPIFVLEITLKSLLIAAAALLMTWFMRRSSAAHRHLYLAAAVVALLLLPLASIVLPSWNVELLPDPFVSSGDAFLSAAKPLETADPTSAPDQMLLARGDTGDDRMEYSGGRTGVVGALYPWLFLVWILGAGILLGRLLVGKLYGHLIASRAPAVEDDRVLNAVKRVSERAGCAREIRVVESDRLNVPFVCGLLRPGLILPSQVKHWPLEQIEAILHHEFAHIKRKDILLQFLAQMACCLYWINPLAWVMERNLFIERERACDDIAINRDIKASEYAGYLMEVLEELGDRRTHVWVMSAMAEGTDFKDRIISVLDPIAKRTTPQIAYRAAVVLSSVLLLLPFSSLHPWEVVEPAAGGSKGQVVESEIDGGIDVAGTSDRVSRREGGRGAAKADAGRGESGGGGQANALITLLDSPNADMRLHAATALSEAGNRRAVPALIEALKDEDASVREHVATALGKIGDSRAVLPLAETVAIDADPRVREHSATALGLIGDTRALPYLIEVVREDIETRVREHAAVAIGMVGGEGALEVLVQVYRDDRDVNVRAHGAYGLGLLKDYRAFDLLIEGLDSRHAEIRGHCAEALGLLGNGRAVAHLRGLLRDSSPHVREQTRRALEMLGEER